MKSNRVSRIVKLLTVMQSSKGHTADELANLFGISRRTVFRDLNELETIGVPYHYDTKTTGYKIDPDFFLPPVDLNLKEALSLLLLAHKSGNQMQTPFRRSAILAAMKIENNLPAEIRRYCHTALHRISTKEHAQSPMSNLDKIFSQAQDAIAKKKVIHLRYKSLFEGKEIELDFCPYHLLYNHRAWYVLGYSRMHNSERTLKLNRVTEMVTLEKCFVDDEKFDVYDYLGRAWSMIPEGKIYNIKLRFLPKVANNVSEVNWHSTQKVTRNEDGTVTMEFRVDGLGEITWWILGYGDQVEVLAPKALRTIIAKTAKNMIKLNTGP